MNATEFLAALAAIPDARTVATDTDGIAESRFVAGLEVARANDPADRALRSTWKKRSRGGPDPLLLVVDDPDHEGVLRALGPVGADGPVHTIAADALLRVVERVAQLPRLQAVRTLAEELDKFQGQQARVVFYSMAASSGADAPRGLGFLFSRNRLNVAVSRAQCLAYVVCAPALLDVDAKTVEHMRLANALCRFVELATP